MTTNNDDRLNANNPAASEQQRAERMRALLANPPPGCRVVRAEPRTSFAIVGHPRHEPRAEVNGEKDGDA